MAAGGRLIDIENDIKALIAEGDLLDPRIFRNIYDLIRLWLLRNKKVTDYNILDDIAMIGAEMLFMKIYKGGTISSWLGYISIAYQSFIREYRDLDRSEIIDTHDNPELAEAIIRMCNSVDNDRHARIVDSEYMIESIPEMIDKVMENSKYRMYTKIYEDARLSLSISLFKGSYTSLFLWYDYDKNYVRVLYNQLLDEIKKYVLKNRESGFGLNMSLAQLYALEESDNDSD